MLRMLPVSDGTCLYTVITTRCVDTLLLPRTNILKQTFVDIVTFSIILLITVPTWTHICAKSVHTRLCNVLFNIKLIFACLSPVDIDEHRSRTHPHPDTIYHFQFESFPAGTRYRTDNCQLGFRMRDRLDSRTRQVDIRRRLDTLRHYHQYDIPWKELQVCKGVKIGSYLRTRA